MDVGAVRPRAAALAACDFSRPIKAGIHVNIHERRREAPAVSSPGREAGVYAGIIEHRREAPAHPLNTMNPVEASFQQLT